jgi:hypothetical protein
MAQKMGGLARHQTQNDWVHDYWLIAYATEQESTVHQKRLPRISMERLLNSFQPLPIPRNGRILGQLCSTL